MAGWEDIVQVGFVDEAETAGRVWVGEVPCVATWTKHYGELPMSETCLELLDDPTYCHNLILWAMEPGPPDAWGRRPMLHQAGLRLVYAAGALSVSAWLELDARLAGVELGPRLPIDVAAEASGRTVLIECAARGWDEQRARSLLAAANCSGTDSTGRGLVLWVVPDGTREQVGDRIRATAAWLSRRRLPCGEAAVVGLAATQDGVVMVLDDHASRELGVSVGTITLLPADRSVPRFPYRVACPAPGQSVSEREYCRRAALERWRGGVLAAVLRSEPPTSIVLDRDWPLLEIGVSPDWRPPMVEGVRAYAWRALDALVRHVSRRVPGGAVCEPGSGWVLRVNGETRRQKTADAISDWDGNGVIDAPPDLFDW